MFIESKLLSNERGRPQPDHMTNERDRPQPDPVAKSLSAGKYAMVTMAILSLYLLTSDCIT